MCKENDLHKEYVRDYINQSIEWLKRQEHNGYNCENQIATMSI